jgi:hypothetical protein
MATNIAYEDFMASTATVKSRYYWGFPNREHRIVTATDTLGDAITYDYGAACSKEDSFWSYPGAGIFAATKYPAGQHSNVDWDGAGSQFEPIAWKTGVLCTYDNAAGQHLYNIQPPFSVEVRAEIPPAKHAFPAAWLINNVKTWGWEPEADNIEFDLFEKFGNELSADTTGDGDADDWNDEHQVNFNVHQTLWHAKKFWRHGDLNSALAGAGVEHYRMNDGLELYGASHIIPTWNWTQTYKIEVRYPPEVKQSDIDNVRVNGGGFPAIVSWYVEGQRKSTEVVRYLPAYKFCFILNQALRTSFHAIQHGDNTNNALFAGHNPVLTVNHFSIDDLKDEYPL